APDAATVAARRAQADRALAEASLAGNTPLYQAIAAGIEEVGPSDDEWTTALIVITDGEDTGGGPSPAELAARVRHGGPRVFVVAVGEATCADPDLSQIITASGGGCVHAGFDTLDRALAGVTEVIWGGDPDDHCRPPAGSTTACPVTPAGTAAPTPLPGGRIPGGFPRRDLAVPGAAAGYRPLRPGTG